MHILFAHKSYPAQFGHIARHLVKNKGYRCSFVTTHRPAGVDKGIYKIAFQQRGGATEKTHYCSRTFENAVWNAWGMYESLKPLEKTLKPDLIVGHSHYGSPLFIQPLFPEAKVCTYFEYYYHTRGQDMHYIPDWPTPEEDYLRARARNGILLLDFEYCDGGYTPTHFQHSVLPETYKDKIRVIHDGIDTDFWKRQENPDRAVGPHSFPEETRIVTYVSRGMESMRGFHIFMKAAKRILQENPNTVVLVVGSDRVCYGGDLRHIQEKTFKEHVLNQDDYDLNRILFLGNVKPELLVRILSLSDVHIYLTVPFVLSWSLLDAMSCGCTIISSETPPVQEVITHEETGLLCDFFDHEAIAETALQVLANPIAYAELGRNARRHIEEKYSMEVCLPRLAELYESIAGK